MLLKSMEIKFIKFNQYDKYFEFTPEIRVIKLTNNDEGCPCGGTHVKKV